MGNMDVTARLLADNAQFDAAMNKSAATATATGTATEKATKRAADATKFAAQYASDAIQKSTPESIDSTTDLTSQERMPPNFQPRPRFIPLVWPTAHEKGRG